MRTLTLHNIDLDDFERLSQVMRENFPKALLVAGTHSDHQDVRDFHNKFGVPMADEPQLPDLSTFEFRMKFLKEELTELDDAYHLGDLHGYADALVDLVYVAHGTAAMAGIPWAPLWAEVQRANMTKQRAASAAESKRGSALDVIKPEGWTGPNFTPWLGLR